MYLNLLLATLLAGAPADETPPMVIIAGDRTIDVTINGKPARLRVDPGAIEAPILSPDAVMRLGLKGSMVAISARIGPIRLPGRTQLVELGIGGDKFDRRAAWFDKPFVTGVDAMIGPATLPSPVVRFEMRSAMPGERIVTMPLADFGRSGMGAWLKVGEATIPVRFNLERDRTIASAPTGAVIAQAHGGTLSGEPIRALISFGIDRPARHMKLATAFEVGPLAIADLWVRTSDYGNAASIPEADADPDEVVVTATSKKKPEYRLDIGRDALKNCSSISFDKPRKLVTLTCL